MSSSKANEDGRDVLSGAALLVDPESVLVRESGQLVDPRFLAALCQELTANLGPETAGMALVQIGCLHGLRDAHAAVSDLMTAPSAQACLPISAALPTRFATQPGTELAIEGSWPEAAEAAAWLSHQPASQNPVCAISAGYTSGWLSQLFEAELVVIETECAATGAEQCRFVARERSHWQAENGSRAQAIADILPVRAMRDALAGEPIEEFPLSQAQSDDPETVIHIWGPVMVVPFTGLDAGLQAVELLRHDESAARVSVIVVDLTDAAVDEGFGASALEQIIDCAEACGAETVLAGVSPLSERAVASLEPQPVLVCKDLHAAIAAGFQVADSQMRLL